MVGMGEVLMVQKVRSGTDGVKRVKGWGGWMLGEVRERKRVGEHATRKR